MTYSLTLPDTEARDLAVTALRSEADRRSRASEQLAGMVRRDKAAGQDVRPSAVRVTMLLGEASELRAMADMLAAASEAGLIAGPIIDPASPDQTPEELDEPLPLPGVDDTPDGDDGTSSEAQRLAALAGLTGGNDIDDEETTP